MHSLRFCQRLAFFGFAYFAGVVVSVPAVHGEESPLPKLVFTHAMGMMPAVNWYSVNGLFPLTAYANASDARRLDFALVYGGSQRIQGLGFFYAFLRADSAYDFNQPYQVWFEQGKLAAHPDFIPYAKAPLENKYRWDMEMAEEMGIDGFAMCLSGNEPSAKHAVNWLNTLEAMLKEKPNTHVRVTMAICGDDIPTPERPPEKYAWLRRLLADRKDSPAWLRHNGRLVFMGYHNQITWNSKDGTDPGYIKNAVELHRKFFASLGIDPIFIFDGTEYVPKGAAPELLKPVADVVCDAFAGYSCWGGVIPNDVYPPNYTAIADTVNQRGKAWMMPIVDIHSGVGQFYQSLPGVERLLKTWDFAAKTNARCVQLVTWNDTAEATGFQPSISWNYALWGLTAKYIQRFKNGAFPEEKEDSVFLFYRKYHADADPYLYPRATVERDADKWGETDDLLHAIVFAVTEGTLEVTGTGEGVSRRPLVKGFNEFKLTTAVNQEITARVIRDGEPVQEIVSPERVTDRPYREDLIPWGWSSACRKLYDRDFGKNFRPISYYSQRYNDGIPDWFRLHYFGTTEVRPGTAATDDPDQDGVDNLHEYLAGENPREPNPVYAPGFTWNELTAALSPITKLPFATRINMNPFPDKNGKLVHTFLYQTNGVFDGHYPHMMKWVNEVPGTQTGWAFRTGRKHNYFLAGDGAIGMNLLPDWAGIYRFWSPVAGTVRVRCTVTAGRQTDVAFHLQKGAERLLTGNIQAGTAEFAELTLGLSRGDRLDFIVHANGGVSAAATLKPEIELVRESDKLHAE